MPLPCLYIYATLLEIHSNINSFPLSSNYHSYETRSSNMIRSKFYKLTKSKNNSLNINLYNILPENIKSLNILQFKRKLKEFLLKTCYYSVDEYKQRLWTDGDWI